MRLWPPVGGIFGDVCQEDTVGVAEVVRGRWHELSRQCNFTGNSRSSTTVVTVAAATYTRCPQLLLRRKERRCMGKKLAVRSDIDWRVGGNPAEPQMPGLSLISQCSRRLA